MYNPLEPNYMLYKLKMKLLKLLKDVPQTKDIFHGGEEGGDKSENEGVYFKMWHFLKFLFVFLFLCSFVWHTSRRKKSQEIVKTKHFF